MQEDAMAEAARVIDESMVPVFAALADPTRLAMVTRLAAGDATVSELAAPFDMSIQAVSKHIKVLESAGVVTRSRQAQTRPVHLEAEVFDLVAAFVERFRRTAEARYRRLDAVLAEALRQAPETGDAP
jgi:DNA-binding transcriptional ArsR family regulator